MMSLMNQLDDASKELFFMSVTDFCARKYYKRLTECKVKWRALWKKHSPKNVLFETEDQRLQKGGGKWKAPRIFIHVRITQDMTKLF